MKFTYTGLEVRDLDRSIKFYTEGLEMELAGRSKVPETDGEVAGLKSKDSEQLLELNWYPKRRYRAGSELDHLAFDVGDGDVDAAMERLVAAGAKLFLPTEVRENFVVGFVTDPDGICIELYKARRKAPPGATPIGPP